MTGSLVWGLLFASALAELVLLERQKAQHWQGHPPPPGRAPREGSPAASMGTPLPRSGTGVRRPSLQS